MLSYVNRECSNMIDLKLTGNTERLISMRSLSVGATDPLSYDSVLPYTRKLKTR